MKTNLFRISNGFAANTGLPVVFTAATLIETPKAIYVYGHGSSDPMGACARCGRALTHPGSILIGIGPECLKDWGARDVRLDALSESDIKHLKSLITTRPVNSWIPKSCIQTISESSEEIIPPVDHPMLLPKSTKKTAELVTFKSDQSDAIKIIFPYSAIDVAYVKSLPGRRFHNEGMTKYWTCPCSPDTIEALQNWGFQIAPELLDILIASKTPAMEISDHLIIPGLKMELFPYQHKGVQFIEAHKGKTLVADEMGLGKTAQALAWLQLHPELRPAIIVVPASLKLNWKKEAEMWMSDPKVQVLSGTKATLPIVGEIIIINYDILKNKFEKYIEPITKKKKERELPNTGWVDFLKEIKPKVIIIDEIHYIKERKTHQTKAIQKLCKKIPHIIGLSGTPIINRPMESFNFLSIIAPNEFPSGWKFAQKYCGAKHNGFGWDFTGASHTDELHKKLTDGIMIRRMKADVLTDLPDKIRSFTPVELKNEKNYRKAESNFIAYIREMKGNKAAEKAKGAEALVQIEILKQVSVQEKLPACIEWIKDFLEVNGHKLVVFANHKFVIDELMNAFPDISVKIDGSVSPDKRQGIVDTFQTDPKTRLFIGNIQAAGVGITLTAASTVAFIELPWSPGLLDQAEDRCHRIGQKDNVNIHYLLAPGTIEDRIAQLLDSKRNVIGQVLDGKDDNGESMFKELIASYKED
jgi:SWI/SNF-related matrix-associated actin-dependent regulator 1 of chromatin subfamily A